MLRIEHLLQGGDAIRGGKHMPEDYAFTRRILASVLPILLLAFAAAIAAPAQAPEQRETQQRHVQPQRQEQPEQEEQPEQQERLDAEASHRLGDR